MTRVRRPGARFPDRAPDARTSGPQATVAALVAAACAYGWGIMDLRPFTWPLRVAVGLPILAVLVAAARRRSPLGLRHGAGELRRGWPWLVLVPALAAVQLFAYFAGFGGARSDYPTLSWIYGHVEWRPARAAAFAGWLALGVYLVRR